MTFSPNGDRLTLQEIKAIEAHLEANPNDWKIKMRLAEALERYGRAEEARKLYQEVVAADPGGVFAGMHGATGAGMHGGMGTRDRGGTGAGENLPIPNYQLPITNYQSPITNHQSLMPNSKYQKEFDNLWQWFYKQPMRRKLLLVLLFSKLMGMSVLVIASVQYTQTSTQKQRLQQADSLVRAYLQHPATKKSLDSLISGNIAKIQLPAPSDTIGLSTDSYSALYLYDLTNDFILATSRETVKNKSNFGVTLPNQQSIEQAVAAKGDIVRSSVKIGQRPYAIAAKALPNANGAPIPVLVLGTLETQTHSLLGENIAWLLGLTVLLLAVDILLVGLLAKAIAIPIQQIQISATLLANGDRTVRAPAYANDEVGQLAVTFNDLADVLGAAVAAMEESVRRYQGEAAFCQREKERLQQGVRQILQNITDTKHGDLTVRAQVEAGELGAIAASFNATLSNLQEIVLQVQTAAHQLHATARNSTQGVQKLSGDSNYQAKAIAAALAKVADMGRSMQAIASTTLQAAVMARQGVVAAKNGYKIMNQTVSSIEQTKESVASASQKVKRLADSSVEISKIVSIIAVISERTNLLAFNASIAAAREKGEQGQVFRMVAAEVGRLAERVTDSAKEIEQLVSTIQEGVAMALQTMESSTNQVETGAQLAVKTQQTLRKLAGISQNINQLLQSISTSTVSQAQSSQQVNQTMQAAAAIAQTISVESKAVSNELAEQVKVSEALQKSVSRFRVEEKGMGENE